MKYLISLFFLIYAGVVNIQAQNINVPFDASGMFSERGYYKSNSISFDNVYIPEDGNSPELKKRTIFYFLFPKPFYGMDPNDHTKEVIFK